MFRILARGLIALLAALLLLVIVVMSMAVLQAYREYNAFHEREAQLAQQLEARQLELQGRQDYLRRVLDDPQFIERVVRDKLGFARPNETIYRFE